MIRVGSLFSGVGGIDLALEWAGLGPVAWQVERDYWRRAVLARHWPDVARFDDVRTVGAGTLEPVDLIAGGFPCRGTSSAGKRTGLAHPESGLWYEFARIVRELLPGAVLVENPASGRGRWLAEASAELEATGYACRDVGVSAREAGSPQFRPRTFLLAKRRPGVADGLRPGREGSTAPYEGRDEPAGRRREGEPGVPDGDGESLREQPRGSGRPNGEDSAIVGAALDLRAYWRRRLGVSDGDAIGRGEVLRPESASAGRAELVGSGGERVPDGESGRRGTGAGVGSLRAGELLATGGARSGVSDGDQDRRSPRADEDPVDSMESRRDAERRDRDDEPRTAAPEPRLGRVVHKLSAGLDGRGRWRWPAARDLPPYSWEAPKLRPAVRGDNRRKRVAALGDSCVPACAFVAALALIDFLAEP